MADFLQLLQESLDFLVNGLLTTVFVLLPFLPWFIQRRWDKRRITDSIEAQGWEVSSIVRTRSLVDWFVRRPGRRYQVVYRTGYGRFVTAECLIHWFIGIEWISSTPFAPLYEGGGTLRSSRECEPWEVARRVRAQRIAAKRP